MDLDILAWYIVGRVISFALMLIAYLLVPTLIFLVTAWALCQMKEYAEYSSYRMISLGIAFLGAAIALCALILSLGYMKWSHDGNFTRLTREGFFVGYGSYAEKYRAEKSVEVKKELVKKATRIDLSPELRRFTLVHLDPPKHVYVTLKDVETGGVHEQVFVSKHCNSYRDNKDGDQFNILMKRWRLSSDPENTVRYEFSDLYSVFCK